MLGIAWTCSASTRITAKPTQRHFNNRYIITPITSALTSNQPLAWFRALWHNVPHVIDDLNSNRISVNYNCVR